MFAYTQYLEDSESFKSIILHFMNVNQWTENDKAYYTWLVNIEPGGKMFTNNNTS